MRVAAVALHIRQATRWVRVVLVEGATVSTVQRAKAVYRTLGVVVALRAAPLPTLKVAVAVRALWLSDTRWPHNG